MKMAPIRAKAKRATAKSGRGTLPSTKSAISLFTDDFRTTKKDKRVIKHASFVSKIEKAVQKPKKRRRASKKLVTNLESLADALPETETGTERTQMPAGSQVNIIKQKTLKHKPGTMKRREKLERLERDRFVRNMAQMTGMQPTAAAGTGGDASTGQSDTGPNRWAALRNFISQTMEQQPAFKTNT